MTLLNSITSNEEDVQKKVLLELGPDEELSKVEKKYSLNALRIFKDRYLLKSLMGFTIKDRHPIYKTVERLDDLFKRVAVSAGLMEVLYDPAFYDKEGGYATKDSYFTSFLQELQEEIKDLDYKDMYKHPLCIHLPYGFIVNPFHYERLIARYLELVKEGRMKLSFDKIINKFRKEEFKLKIIPLIRKYYELMCDGIFLPNTPALMNAGTKIAQNAACFTLPIHDDMESIIKTQGDVMRVFKSGGGIGINYSELRPSGSFINSTGGTSPGPMTFLKIMDEITGGVKQGGKRRGAAMAELNVDHPDIESFIDSKVDNKSLTNHNISVVANNKFFRDYLKGDEKAVHLMDKIAKNAWVCADPGMVFLENMNSNNLLQSVFSLPIMVTNPCSEIAMYPYDSCNLASINLTKFVTQDGKFDIEGFINVTRIVTRFLDGLIDSTKYPIEEINEMTKKGRRIGVGFMGLGDVLTIMGIPYNSEDGFLFTEYVTALMSMASLIESNRQGDIKGAFPLWYDDKYPKEEIPVFAWSSGAAEDLGERIEPLSKYFKYQYTEDKELFALLANMYDTLVLKRGMRNCSTTTIAPTGTLSMFVDCSSGIEPVFSHGFTKKVTVGEFNYINKHLEDVLHKKGIHSTDLISKIVKENAGSLYNIKGIPDDIKRVFVTAMDIHPFDHLVMQASAQKWITNGISKTINAPEDIDEDLVKNIYVLAWEIGCKGTTVYRDNCKTVQVLNNEHSINKPKISDLKISEYTKEYIQDLDLPEDFKNKLLSKNNTQAINAIIMSITGGIKSFTIPSICNNGPIMFVGNCMNCGAQNSHERSGSPSCFLCRSCGSSIGSCS